MKPMKPPGDGAGGRFRGHTRQLLQQLREYLKKQFLKRLACTQKIKEDASQNKTCNCNLLGRSREGYLEDRTHQTVTQAKLHTQQTSKNKLSGSELIGVAGFVHRKSKRTLAKQIVD